MSRALTLHQPYASLVALGVKSIETRSWSTSYRGRLLIHAAQMRPPGGEYGAWTVAPPSDPLRRRQVPLPRRMYLTADPTRTWHDLPAGAVVASCTLADVVPITHRPGHYPTRPTVNVERDGVRLFTGGADALGILREWTDVGGQYAYGDFTPGRFAWLLSDVAPTTERCPACWGDDMTCGIEVGYGYGTVPCVRRRGHDGGCSTPADDPDVEHACTVCDDAGRCDPVPAKGRQRLWNWEPSDA